MIWLIPIFLLTAYTIWKAYRHFRNDHDDGDEV
jgi:hypothetical protein